MSGTSNLGFFRQLASEFITQKMADSRFNQVPGFAGGGFQVSQQNAALSNVSGVPVYMPGGITVNPMMQQQMMIASGMRFPMQGMRMGPPNTPPPPYNMHAQVPGVPGMVCRPRTSLNKSKDSGHQSEKERFFEEQRQKLRQFGKPGSARVDADKLIGPIFSAERKPQPSKVKAQTSQMVGDDDDGFGDFLQGPSAPASSGLKGKENVPVQPQEDGELTSSEPEPVGQEEKKDLKSMMFEYSDLSAPKKAKGFHKPTLNEVQKLGQKHHKPSVISFSESDHSRSWKQNTEDLEGLFQMPVAPKPAVQPTSVIQPSPPQHHVYAPQHALSAGVAVFPSGSAPMSGPPPYSEVVGSPSSPAVNTAAVASTYVSTTVIHPGSGELSQSQAHLPDWCLLSEDQLPPVYKQVLEASLVKGKISTERLYPILLLSGLPREKLAQIWSLCNTATPGQLARNELWLVLSLIALTQNNCNTSSLEILVGCPMAPVPVFAQVQDVSSPATLPTTPQQHQTHPSQSYLVQQPQTPPSPAHVTFTTPVSHPSCQQLQPHQIQQPKAVPAKPPGSTSTEKAFASDQDDFADFQQCAASTPVTVSFGKGHTSPSFEDDDFTDGRDSLSQVSSSEPSENEDIHNFENYVEEFHQQKQKADGSPLHCPFPTVQQTQAARVTKGRAQASQPSSQDPRHAGKPSRLNLGPSSTSGRHHRNVNPGFNQPHGGGSDFANFKSASLPTSVGSARNVNDEFADFKSAPQVASIGEPSVQDVTLIGDEDKYGALRVLSLDQDFAQPSIFEGQGHTSASSQQSGQSESGATEEEDWADFSTAPGIGDSSDSQNAILRSAMQKDTGQKDSILKLFSMSHGTASASASSDVASDGGSKNGSIFGDDSASTPSHGQSLGPSMPSANSLNDQHASKPGLGWGERADDWAGFNSDCGGDGFYHRSEHAGWAGSPDGTDGKKPNLSGDAASTRLPLKTPSANETCAESDWGLYTSVDNRAPMSQLGNVSAQGGESVTDQSQDDWCDFSAADSSTKAGVGVEAEQFVTIRKQNLGAGEIMGLFKVRDDQATMSSYQLPQQPPNKNASRSHLSSGRRRRSELDDDDMAPPPMDFMHEEEFDEHEFSRGYDLDDFMHRAVPSTIYNPFGMSHSSPVYSQSGGIRKLKENKEDSSSVHSLDLPSTRPADPSGSDSQSVSSADLTPGDASAGVVESKSLDSLDLHSENGDYDLSDQSNRADVPGPHHHPIQPQELLATMPDFADKYNIEREAQGSDCYGLQWERCLLGCCRVICEANTLFNSISSSSVCNEVLKSTQGSEYVTSVIEIYRVVCRIQTSLRSTAISTTEVEQTLKDIDLAWNNLSAFLAGASLLPKQASLMFTDCILKSDSELAQNVACGLCLLNVDVRPAVGADCTDTNSCKLTYAGRQYHAACANLWVNCVDQTLPCLTLPDLL